MYIFTKGAKRKSKILTDSDQRFWYVTATEKQIFKTCAILLYYTKHHHKYIVLVRYNIVVQLNFTCPKKTPFDFKEINKNKNTNFLRLEDNQWPFFQLPCARCGIATYTFTCTCKSWVLSYSGAPEARRAAKRSIIPIWEGKGNPWVDFLMVIMASGIARGCVRTTEATMEESRNMSAIIQVIAWHRRRRFA